MRQVVEAMSVALLASSCQLNVLSEFVNCHYSTNKAVDQLLKHHKMLCLNKDAVEALRTTQKSFNDYSHPTKKTICVFLSMQHQAPYVGAAFGEGKTEVYDREVEIRLGLASVFPNFVKCVLRNLTQ